LVTYHKVFDGKEHLNWGAKWMLKNLDLPAIGFLLKENVYSEVMPYVRHRIFINSESNLGWNDFYLDNFHKDTFERKQVYLYSFALLDNEKERNARILDFLEEFWEKEITLIEPYWKDCGLRLFVAGASPSLAGAIHQDCLECIDELNSFILYANIDAFNPHFDGFNRIYRSLRSHDLRTLQNQYPQLYERIGDVFVKKAESVGDIDWYLETYLDEEYDRKRASEKGIELEAILHGKGASLTKRIARHQLNVEFGFDPSLVSEYIGCEQMLPFLKLVETTEWVDELFPIACRCITPQNVKQYKVFFNHLPGFQEKVLDGIFQSLDLAAQKTTPSHIPSLNKGEAYLDSINLQKMDHPVFVLNVKGEMEKGVSYQIEFPDGTIQSLFTNEKVEFLIQNIDYVILRVSNEKASWLLNRNPSSKDHSIIVFDCPPAFHAHFRNIVVNKTLREYCLDSSEDILNHKGDFEDYKQVLGVSIVKFVGEDKSRVDELDFLALETASFYFNLAQPYYPERAIDRVLKDLSKALEGRARSLIKAE
jgi:hypothetical protein